MFGLKACKINIFSSLLYSPFHAQPSLYTTLYTTFVSGTQKAPCYYTERRFSTKTIRLSFSFLLLWYPEEHGCINPLSCSIYCVQESFSTPVAAFHFRYIL